MKAFFPKWILFTVLTGTAVAFSAKYVDALPKVHALLLAAFFALLSLMTHLLMDYSIKKWPEGLPVFYLGTTALRLVMGLGIGAAYMFLLEEKQETIAIIVCLLALYLIWLVFETAALLPALRQHQTTQENKEES